MMMEFYNGLVNRIAKEEGIPNPEITITASTTLGQGFLGTYHFADIEGNGKRLHLFLKSPPESQGELKEVMRNIHLNEFLFYDEIYPMFETFEEAKQVEKKFKSLPKCYKIIYERNKETLILANVKMEGYKGYNKKEPLDDEHMFLALAEIAHFHAVSFALKDQNPAIFKEAAEKICCPNMTNGKEDFMATVEYFAKTALNILNPDNFSGYQLFKSFSKNISTFMDSIDELSGEFTVINHGDLTNNNILFKYDDDSTRRFNAPTDVCIYDFQLIREASPVFDLSYFFYGSCSEKQMKNLDLFHQFYYAKLVYYVEKLGGDAKILYPWWIFQRHWKSLARYGLAMSLIILKLMVTESDDLAEQSEKRSMLESLSFKIKNEDLYRERIKTVISHFVERGFLEPLDK